ncbi:hypothetical protein GFS31_41470 (plasmid) [Leptolyngbya sp. BL0902]|uniref:hypothetical protein n=1 Tax=Leptolyngbya sp. BL0902 TaxID=1115757 RepID=UPI0018E76E03|nr:hypothetical protein [Leptolyngbya sp. BL0902]QQE67434.1 hypothetical protein GFS31_41470 [Leptolyngbya sp. BL0902]
MTSTDSILDRHVQVITDADPNLNPTLSEAQPKPDLSAHRQAQPGTPLAPTLTLDGPQLAPHVL